MNKQVLNIGAAEDDPNSDSVRAAFDKVNQNFTELFRQAGQVKTYTNTANAAPDADTDNYVEVNALEQALTIINPAGTPINKQKLVVEITANDAYDLTWGNKFVSGAIGLYLPALTIQNTTMTMGFQYSTANGLNKWKLMAILPQS